MRWIFCSGFFLFMNDGQFTVALAAWIAVPVIIQAIALVMLFLPGSGRWFGRAT
jgi:hypothetical protein